MGKKVIQVQNLSKRYRLGLKEKQANTLVGQIAYAIKSPLENLKRLRELNKFGREDESVFWALEDVSFEVKEGEVFGIIGKNGAGKSTLLKILSQITEPTTGKIEIHGRVASLLEVGTGFHPELSGRENIYMNGTILGMTRREIDTKLDEIIDFSGVEKFIDTPVKFYSSGMKVRLGFSVAAHLDPEILIIDEVLAVGDFEFQRKCLGKMEDVSRNQGRTVLFVSHNMGAISSLCNRLLILKQGEVKYDGNVDIGISKYFSDSNKEGNSLKDLDIPGTVNSCFKFLDLFINNKNPFERNLTFSPSEKLIFKITWFSDLSNGFKIVFSIFQNGIKIFTLHDQKDYLNSRGTGTSTFVLRSHTFRPGRYQIAMGIHDAEDNWMWQESITSFEILEIWDFETNKRDFGLLNASLLIEEITRN